MITKYICLQANSRHMQVQCGACVNLEDIIYVNLEEIRSTWVATNCGTMQSRIVTWNMEDMEMLEKVSTF